MIEKREYKVYCLKMVSSSYDSFICSSKHFQAQLERCMAVSGCSLASSIILKDLIPEVDPFTVLLDWGEALVGNRVYSCVLWSVLD